MKQPSKTFLRAGGLLLALAAATGAQADELPMLREGLWEMKLSVQMTPGDLPPGMKGALETARRQCVDQASEKEARDMLLEMDDTRIMSCKREVKKTAAGYTVDSVCTSKLVGTTTTMHIDIVGDFSSGQTLKATAHTEGGKHARGARSMTMTGQVRYLGACPAGWKPGDVEEDGHRFNVRDGAK